MMDRHHILHRRDRLGELVNELFPRQRGRDDDDDDEDEQEEKATKKGPKTVIRTSYRTLEPTFSGSVAGYSTRQSKDDDDDETATTTSRPKSTVVSETITSVETTPASDAAETQIPASTESASASSNEEGMSGGAKAGIAIGAVAGVLALVGLVFLLLAKKRKQRQGMQNLNDDEKLHGSFGPGGYAPTPAQAAAAAARGPGAQGVPVNQHAHMGAQAAPIAAGAVSRSPSGGSSWERPMTSSSQNAANPFGSHAELPGSRPTTPPSNGHTAVAAAVAGGIGAAAGAAATRGLQRQTSRNHGQKQLDLTLPPPGPAPSSAVPPSPARTEYSVSSVPSGQQAPVTAGSTAIAAAGGPPGSAVHRVQLDFEPTLDDELGLKAGQLVRLLHEYDDGWALCIRLDRSRQGVVPRTCLSTRPVKPRNGPSQHRMGPPVNPASRPITPKSGSPPPVQSQNPASRPTTPGQQSIHQQPSPGPRYQPMPPRSHTPNSTGATSPAPSRVMSPAPGPLSAPMAPPASSAASAVSALTPSERSSPSPKPVEMPCSTRVAENSPVLPPVEFTPLRTPPPTEPIGSLDPIDKPAKAPSPAPAAEAAPVSEAASPTTATPPSPSTPLGGGAPKRKPVPGQAS